MIVYFNVKDILYGLFDALTTRVTKFNNFTSIGYNDMVVLLVKIRFFVMCLVLPKLMTAYQTTFQKQFYRIVKGCPANTVVFVFHFYVQRFNIEMLFALVYFLKNGIAFRCFSMTFFF